MRCITLIGGKVRNYQKILIFYSLYCLLQLSWVNMHKRATILTQISNNGFFLTSETRTDAQTREKLRKTQLFIDWGGFP